MTQAPGKFTVWFEIGGHKMKTEVRAFDKEQAKRMVFDKITFHKVEGDTDKLEGIMKEFIDILK